MFKQKNHLFSIHLSYLPCLRFVLNTEKMLKVRRQNVLIELYARAHIGLFGRALINHSL